MCHRDGDIQELSLGMKVLADTIFPAILSLALQTLQEPVLTPYIYFANTTCPI